MLSLIFITALIGFASSKPCANEAANSELILSLNKDLLRSVENQAVLPNPSIHLALRLSNHHNLAKEREHLTRLRAHLHDDIHSSLSNSQPVVGLMALYTMALKASCFDLTTVTFNVSARSETLLVHLKKQLDQEKDHIAYTQRPLTNYYQYSLGVLALCVNSIRVHNHVSHKLMKAIENEHLEGIHIDTYAMAGMALQCVKDDGCPLQNAVELDRALSKIKLKLLAAGRADGHIGNEFSTGLAVQALLAMGSPVSECGAAMEAMRTDARSNTYHNPMAISQVLPALQRKTYLHVKTKECLNEDDTLVLEPVEPVTVSQCKTKVALVVEVVAVSGVITTFPVEVPKGSSLLQALQLLQEKSIGFSFKLETSLWGPYLSEVNGEQARQSDRRYWHLASDDTALSEGIKDFKIEGAQKITIKNTNY